MTSRHAELVLSGFAGAALLFLFLLMMGSVSCSGLLAGEPATELSAVGVAGPNALPPYQIPDPDPDSGLARLSASERATPIAVINGVAIPLAELQDRLDKQSPYIRAKYSAPEKRKEILDQLIDLEVLAQAAAQEGFISHPDVLRQTKQAMIQKFIDKTFSKQFTIDSITDAEVEAYYNERKDQYNQPEMVRVSHILVPDKATADQILASAKAKKDARAWKTLVVTHSQDAETKPKGGDLGYIARDDTTKYEEALVSAGFALQNNGDLTVVQTTKGWHVLRLTGRRKANKKELKDLSAQIRQQLFSARRKEEFERFKGELREKSQVEVYYQSLDALQLNVGAAPTKGTPPGLPAGMPGRSGNLQEAIRKATEEARAKAAANEAETPTPEAPAPTPAPPTPAPE